MTGITDLKRSKTVLKSMWQKLGLQWVISECIVLFLSPYVSFKHRINLKNRCRGAARNMSEVCKSK